MDWTPEQENAIKGINGTMLVSAAAGSGKTAVLVERVIRRICNRENPCGIENLLIVTFTKAAASQMKEKISKALAEKIAENPGDRFLRHQKMMIPYANICTIDSFCINLVRENFHALDITPDFTILDEGKIKILESTAVTTVIDKLYSENSPEFTTLIGLINNEKDDRKLISAIQTLYSLSRAYPFPEIMLDNLCNEYAEIKDIKETSYGKIIIDYAKGYIDNTLESIEHCLKIMENEPELYEKYSVTFKEDKIIFDELKTAIANGIWDEICRKINSVSFPAIKRAPQNYSSDVKTAVNNIRNDYKKDLSEKIAPLFSVSERENTNDIESLYPVIKSLTDAVKEYGNELQRLKAEENGLDFSDTLHLAIDLLVKYENGKIKRTPLAKELSENYAEILVDEYQDVNRAQDIIFVALSKKDSNRFMVGDVKQSIYRFRQAMPEIFLGLKNKFTDYDGVNYPAKVILGKNFRSKKGITETVNFVFRQLMSAEAGKIEYDKGEYLVPGADYEPSDTPDTEICLIQCENNQSIEKQAIYIGNRIKEYLSQGLKVGNKGCERNAQYRDFAILLRSAKERAKSFQTVLEEMGIPTVTDNEESFIEAPEIMFMISLLKVIDNPTNDVPLTAVLFSPVFGFTADDIAKLRIDCKDGTIYNTLVTASENGSKKAKDFIESLEKYRELSVTMPSGEFTAKLIDETGYKSIVGAMKNGEARVSNLNQFIETANAYDKTGIPGIAGFIRFLDKLCDSKGTLLSKSRKTDTANAVTITTVHKSKGLEYPVCFLAGCEKKNNDRSQLEDMIISNESGIGFKRIIDRVKYPTLPHYAAKISTKIAEHSEELRVLYVAMTRPKEKLIILASDNDWEKKLASIGSKIRNSVKISPYTVNNLNGFSEYLLYTLMKHPDAHALRNAAGLSAGIAIPCSAALKTEIIKTEIEESVSEEIEEEVEIDEELLKALKERVEYKYPYDELENVVAWKAASSMEENGFNEEYFASSKPAFTGKNELTPAQRGIATHRFMQYCSYENLSAESLKSAIQNELERLKGELLLTDEEAKSVNTRAVEKFFSSELAKRVMKSEKVLREYSFCASIPLREAYPNVSKEQAGNDIIVIKGISDCAFIEDNQLVVIDYKTDRTNSEEELKNRYLAQLNIYKKCLEMSLEIPVKETYIYSFALNKEIKVG